MICLSTFIAQEALFTICHSITSLAWILCLIELSKISILVASIPLVYYLSRRLASSRSIAFLAVLALCYHPRLAGLVFVGAFIYDVLCGFFYFAALAYYVNIRERGASLRPLQLLGFLALYVMALNCKEMAVTLPVIVLIYEFLEVS